MKALFLFLNLFLSVQPLLAESASATYDDFLEAWQENPGKEWGSQGHKLDQQVFQGFCVVKDKPFFRGIFVGFRTQNEKVQFSVETVFGENEGGPNGVGYIKYFEKFSYDYFVQNLRGRAFINLLEKSEKEEIAGQKSFVLTHVIKDHITTLKFLGDTLYYAVKDTFESPTEFVLCRLKPVK